MVNTIPIDDRVSGPFNAVYLRSDQWMQWLSSFKPVEPHPLCLAARSIII
jgi:hypothetical protein